MYASGRHEIVKHDYVYSYDSFVADAGGYLVSRLEHSMDNSR
jgi:hypothetical protein